MKLTILDSKTSEELDSYKATHWLEAVQFVEKNKKKYMKKGCEEVSIRAEEGVCNWLLTPEVRPLLLNDMPFVEPKRTKAKRIKWD